MYSPRHQEWTKRDKNWEKAAEHVLERYIELSGYTPDVVLGSPSFDLPSLMAHRLADKKGKPIHESLAHVGTGGTVLAPDVGGGTELGGVTGLDGGGMDVHDPPTASGHSVPPPPLPPPSGIT